MPRTKAAPAQPSASGLTPDAGGRRLPRTLHPVAWWIWALALATAVSRTNNPLLLFLVLAVLGYVIT
ncbi:energy-coupling factor transporter transmembrane protein EcfT, partial [Streptomyces sp. NPDC057674]